MKPGYFRQVSERTQTRLWINNPSRDDAEKALQAGAIACTTNPTFAARMLRLDETRDEALKVVDQALSETRDISEAATLVQRHLIAGMSKSFLPLFEQTGGKEGFVSLQLDPNLEQDATKIVAEALADFALFPNCIAKIPVIPSGLTAIDCLVRLNKPVIATEIMAISQAIAVCEVYRKASEESGNSPAFFVTHISGILDEHLKAEAQSLGLTVSDEAFRIAGCAVAKKQYKLMKERNLPGILLGGGARDLHHFTELVGGQVHVTLNWPGSAAVLDSGETEVVNRLDQEVPEHLIQELTDKLPTFALAYAEDGLTPAEFDEFGPVVRFRTQFLKGWNELLDAVASRRKQLDAQNETFEILQQGRKFCRLGENPAVEIRPGVMRSTLVYTPETMLCHFSEKAGAEVGLHDHFAVQSGYVLSGKVKFYDHQGNERIMEAGDSYLFHSHEPHGSVALEDTELIEIFTPSRTEYLDKH